jgi:hypothetical protein
MNEFGHKIKKYLKFHGFKQYQLAAEADLHPTYLSKVLSGWFPVTQNMQRKILGALKTLEK